MRRVFPYVALVVLLALIAYLTKFLMDRPNLIAPDDYVEYWAAGRLNIQGKNPYDAELLLELQRGCGEQHTEAIMMWNPPWTLCIAMPFGAFPSVPSHLFWVLTQMLLVIISVELLWRYYGGPLDRRWIAWAFGLAFFPTLNLLKGGQIGGYFLLGATLFLVFERRQKPMLAGAVCVLMAVKPHLMYLFWPALAIWALRRPGWSRSGIIVGGILMGIICSAIPLIFNKDVFQHYTEAMTQRPPDHWQTPTLGGILRKLLDDGSSTGLHSTFRLQFMPMILGFGWFIYDQVRNWHRPWDWSERLPMILLVSFLTTPYGAWAFDVVLLYPAFIQAMVRMGNDRMKWRVTILVLAVSQIITLYINLQAINFFWTFWLAPVMWILYLYQMRGTQPT